MANAVLRIVELYKIMVNKVISVGLGGAIAQVAIVAEQDRNDRE